MEAVKRIAARDADKFAADKFGYCSVTFDSHASLEVSIVGFFKDADSIRFFFKLFGGLSVKLIFKEMIKASRYNC